MLTSARPLVLGSKPAHSHLIKSRIPVSLKSIALQQRHRQTRAYCLGWPRHSPRLNSQSRRETPQEREARIAKLSATLLRGAELVQSRHGWYEVERESRRAQVHSIQRMLLELARNDSSTKTNSPAEALNSTPDNREGARPGQNIEDAERKPLEGFIFRHHYQYGSDLRDRNTFDWSYRLRNLRNPNDPSRRRNSAQYDVVGCTPRPLSTAMNADGSGIDPITNRRVAKTRPEPTSKEILDNDPTGSYNRFAASRFAAPGQAKHGTAPRQPIHSDGPPPKEELERYAKVKIDDIEPVKPASPASPASLTADSSLPATDEELQKYAKVDIDDITTPQTSSRPARHLFADAPSAKEVYVSSYPSRDASVAKTEHSFDKSLETSKPDTSTEYFGPTAAELKEYKKNWGYDESKCKDTQNEPATCDQAELDKYKAKNGWGYNESKAKTVAINQPVCDQAELDGYKAKNGWGYNEPKVNAVQDEQPVCDQAELDGYKGKNGWGYNESKATAVQNEKPVCEQAELDGYKAKNGWGYNEPEAAPSSMDQPVCDQAEFDSYKGKNGWGYNETKGTATSDELPVCDQAELGQYKGKNSWGYNETKGTAAADPEPACDKAELEKYKGGFGYNEPDGKSKTLSDPVAESLKEYDDSPDNAWIKHNLSKLVSPNKLKTASLQASEKSDTQRNDSEDMDIDALRAKNVRASAGKITGQLYWNRACETFKPAPKLESALSRTAQKLKMTSEASSRGLPDDLYFKVPQGLETSFAEENGGLKTLPVIKRTYLGKPKRVVEAQAFSSPNVYKILAYDPTMQSISVAEASSIVPDSSGALTPPEVLIHLSNPSKFFPHFAPLQAEGFEIVSGSGDVLVFRKVRDAVTETQKETSVVSKDESIATGSEAFTEAKSNNASAINPIDMTDTLRLSPASGNYASSTGYVNYDLPWQQHDEDLSPPPTPASERFQSGINVKREKPVFSGGRYHSEQPKKKSLGKRMLVGAVWVASGSYALGVVSEYFKTGGTDGKGPQGL